MTNKNAAYIAWLKKIRMHVDDYMYADDALAAVDVAIAALRAQGRSPWHKVTASVRRNYAGKEAIVAWEDGTVSVRVFPDARYSDTEWISVYNDRALWFCLLPEHPEHPEKETKVR